jgi:predicted phage terminase large subunit-like protein
MSDLEAFQRLIGALPPEQAARAIEARIAALPPESIEALAAHPAVQQRVDSYPGSKERRGATARYTPRQQEAADLLASAATHVMLFGGSRSGKTFLILRDIVERALEHTSRHAVLRFRFNHLKASIIFDTFPKMMGMCFPGAAWKLDKVDWLVRFENGSEIWFGGLDDKERTEKILGQEYSSIFLNECSQIPLGSRDVAVTRLAQKTPLALKMYYDCNPPSKRHWTYLYFIDHVHPARHQPLERPDNYVSLQVNPEHNRPNLPAEYFHELEQLDERKRQRFLLGIFADDDETALWTPETLDKGRLIDRAPPEMQRIVIAVDPSGCSGPEDLRSDEVGIVVAGLGTDGRGYILEDLSGRHGPERWKTIVASAFDRWRADTVVAEVNFGGAMVGEVIRTAATANGLPIPFREVTASRGKVVRAEPIAVLFGQGKVSLVGRFEELEHQLCAMTTAGYRGDRSPDRADAAIWALTAIFPAIAREARQGGRASPRVVLAYAGSKQHVGAGRSIRR